MTKLRTVAQCLAILILPAMILAFSPSAVLAQEHPEHPMSSDSMDNDSSGNAKHMEHPQKETAKVDMESVAIAIGEYVQNDTKLKGGFFFVYDPVLKRALTLTLSKIHKERLAQVGDNLFFACSDFDEQGGKVFDLDFFLMEKGDRLVVTEVMIHKEDGNPRYSWFEENGIWKRK